jgi:hypothetical protein
MGRWRRNMVVLLDISVRGVLLKILLGCSIGTMVS